MLLQKLHDKQAGAADILVHTPEISAFGIANWHAQSGPYRIHHDHVGHIQDGKIIVGQLVRGCSIVIWIIYYNTLRTHYTHVQPVGRGSRTSIVGKNDGSIFLRVILEIGRVAIEGYRLVVLVLQLERTRLR